MEASFRLGIDIHRFSDRGSGHGCTGSWQSSICPTRRGVDSPFPTRFGVLLFQTHPLKGAHSEGLLLLPATGSER